MRIKCEHGVFTSVAAVELIDKTDVPVCFEAMMTIKLQLVVLTVVVTLNHYSCMVNVFSVLMPNIFYDKSGCIWLLCDFLEILIELNIVVIVPLML